MGEVKREWPRIASSAHAAAATAAADFFSGAEIVDGVLLVGSWARGHADETSDLDIAIVVTPESDAVERQELVAAWEQSAAHAEAVKVLRPIVRYSNVEIDLIDGEFVATPRGWTSGPDDFELQLGNYVAYSVPLFERGARCGALRDRWLPFYDDDLRARRLESVRTYCLNNLDHVPWALERGDSFHAFHRMYHAFQEFLQALFISRRTYPVAYDKWIAEQLDELLGLPELAPELAGIVGAGKLDGTTIAESAATLQQLFDAYVEETT